MLEGFCPHREADSRWGKKLYTVIDYRYSPRSSTDIGNAFLGNLETGTLLWWIFCQKAGTCADDCKLHQLLQHRKNAAQFECVDTDGKPLIVSDCIKNKHYLQVAAQNFIFFDAFCRIAVQISHIRRHFVTARFY